MNKNYKKLLMLIVFSVNFYTLFAQSLKGKITDSSGMTMPGVSVLVSGTINGTSTNANGEYALKFPAAGNYQLKISFVGYETLIADVAITDTTQTQDFTLSEVKSNLDEVVVIGSRSSVPRSNILTPVPVDVIAIKDVKGFAQVDISQVLNYVAPSFSSNRQTVVDGTDHIDPASLRGLGPDQVLVLVNGKRQHTTALVNINGSFGRGSVGTDMNIIPLAAIERLEVLRDGAAAQYGSDAIAGVINIVLKKNTPLTISTMYGQSVSEALGRTFNDGKNYQVDISKGFDLGGKGFFNIAGQYLNRAGTNRGGLDTRPLLYRSNPTKGKADDGTDITETDQEFQTRFAGLKAEDDAKAAAAGLDRNNMRVGNSDSRNAGVFLNGQYTLAKNVDAYLVLGYTNKIGEAAGNYRLPSQANSIDVSLYPNGFLPLINTNINDYSISGGVKGKLGSWDYDLSNTYGKNTIAFKVSNSLNASLPLGTSPTTFDSGQLSFAQNTSNLDFNRRFDFNGFLQSLNTAFGTELRIDQFQITAGEELSYSFGQPSKGIDGRMVGSANTIPGAQVFPGYKAENALNKSRNNFGFYADLEAELGSKLLVGAAGRQESYSDFGSNFSYKFTGRFKVVDNFAIRGAVATGFRAPSLHQRYFNNISTQFVGTTPSQTLTVNNDNPIVAQFGVGSLKAETSNSYSLGLTGKITKSLSFTLDAYQINIQDRIILSSPFARSNGIVAGILDASGQDPTKTISNVLFFSNAVSTQTKGIDVILTDNISMGTKGDRLILSATANFNQTRAGDINTSNIIANSEYLKTQLFNRLERSRIESAVPKNKINLSANYTTSKWGVLLRSVRFGEVTYLHNVDPTIAANSLPLEIDQTFSAKWITDLTVNYKFTKQLNLAVGVNNLFDVYPDLNYINPRNNSNNLTNYSNGLDRTNAGRFAYSRDVSQFGFNGRYVFGKLSYTL